MQSAPAPKPVASAALPAPQRPANIAQNAPHPLVAQQQPQPDFSNRQVVSVMQAVPFDPLAGPVKTASRKPKPAADAASNTADTLVPPVITIDPKAKPADANAVPALRLTADARSP